MSKPFVAFLLEDSKQAFYGILSSKSVSTKITGDNVSMPFLT